jgi:hypothetical protein
VNKASANHPISDTNAPAQTLDNSNRQASSPLNPGEAMNATGEIMNGLSPFGLGMDLGEFILDGDLEFLNQMTVPINANGAFAT